MNKLKLEKFIIVVVVISILIYTVKYPTQALFPLVLIIIVYSIGLVIFSIIEPLRKVYSKSKKIKVNTNIINKKSGR